MQKEKKKKRDLRTTKKEDPVKELTSDNAMETIRGNIQAFTDKTGVSVNKLAKGAGVAPNVINKILNGESQDIMLSTAIAIQNAMYLRISVDEVRRK